MIAGGVRSGESLPGKSQHSSDGRTAGANVASGRGPGRCVLTRCLIEVPHEAETVACARAIAILQATGSHCLTRAEYGCRDGVHTGWLIVEAKDKDEIRFVVPPPYRDRARVIQLTRFTVEEIGELLEQHGQSLATTQILRDG